MHPGPHSHGGRSHSRQTPPPQEAHHSLLPECQVVGDLSHTLLDCSLANSERALCTHQLSLLYFPVALTLNILYGSPPPHPPDPSLHNERAYLQSIHDHILKITGTFLTS